MKKKALIYALLASVLVGTVASCDDKNNNNNNIVNVDPTPKEDPKKEEPADPKKEEPETPKYNFEDNEESKKVYEEFSKYFTNVSYEDFLLNAKKSSVMGGILFEYKELSVTLNFDGSLKLKSLISIDGNKKTSTEYKYLNNEWVKTKETLTLNGKELITYLIGFKADDSYYGKDEYTYDDNGNQLTNVHSVYENDAWVCSSKTEKTYDEAGSTLTSIESKYVNNEWITTSKYKYINGEAKNTYSLFFKDDGSFNSKNERTYDENGNELTGIVYRYIDNKWEKTQEWIYINGESKDTYVTYYDNDGKMIQTQEYTYDEFGNKLTVVVSQLINDEWITTSKYKYINGETKCIYSLYFKDDGSFDEKREGTYDENDNLISFLCSFYIDNKWVSYSKTEYTYDETGKELSSISYNYIDNNWLKTRETKCINDESKTTYLLNLYKDGTFAYSETYSYDEKGNTLSKSVFDYMNNRTSNYKYINGEAKCTYSLDFKDDGSYDFKNESTYDENGNLVSSNSYDYINNEWVRVYGYIYINDDVINTCFNSKKDDGTYVFIQDDTYDESGNKLASTYIAFENNMYSGKYETLFDENGKEKTETYFVYVDGEWSCSSKHEYTYDNSGNKTSNLYFRFENDEWTCSSKREYTYDSKGSIIFETLLYYTDNEWKRTEETHYYYEDDNLSTKIETHYNFNGRTTLELISNYVNNNWVYSSKTEYGYKDNQISYYDRFEYIKNHWIRLAGIIYINGKELNSCSSFNKNDELDYTVERTYDSNGKIVSILNTNFKDYEYVSKTEGFLDENGKTYKNVYYDYKNNEWIHTKTEECTYYDDGHLKTKTEYFYLNDICESKTENTYDEWGAITSKHYIYQNGEWIEQ